MNPLKFPSIILAVLAFAFAAFAPDAGQALAAVATGTTLLAAASGVSFRTGVLFASSVTISALNSAFSAAYHDSSKGVNDLYAQVFEKSAFDTLFDVIETDLTELRMATSTSTALIQSWQLGFTPSSSVTFDDVKIPLRMIKVDMTLNAHEIYNSFIGFLYKQGQKPSAQLYVKYILEKHVLPQTIEDHELNLAYLGEYAAPTPPTPGAVGTAMDGFRIVINDAVTATTVTPIAVGAAPTDAVDYCTWVEDFADGISNKDINAPMTIAMSLAGERLFMAGNRSKYNNNYMASGDLRSLFFRPNLKVQGFAAMGTSSKIFCSPKGNIVKGVNTGSKNLFNFEGEDRTLKVWADWQLAYGIIRHDRFYTSDTDLA